MLLYEQFNNFSAMITMIRCIKISLRSFYYHSHKGPFLDFLVFSNFSHEGISFLVIIKITYKYNRIFQCFTYPF